MGYSQGKSNTVKMLQSEQAVQFYSNISSSKGVHMAGSL